MPGELSFGPVRAIQFRPRKLPPSSDFGATSRRDKQRIRVNSRKSRSPSLKTRANFQGDGERFSFSMG
jgi:hypothetical protein